MLWRIDFEHHDRGNKELASHHGFEAEDRYSALLGWVRDYTELADDDPEEVRIGDIGISIAHNLVYDEDDPTVQEAIKLFVDNLDGVLTVELEYVANDDTIYQILDVRPEDTKPCPTCDPRNGTHQFDSKGHSIMPGRVPLINLGAAPLLLAALERALPLLQKGYGVAVEDFEREETERYMDVITASLTAIKEAQE